MQFCRMPQGYKNSPAIFQQAMILILKDLLGKICLVYIDDILIFGENKETHNKNLDLVVNRLQEYGLEENFSKRIECVEEVKFLGYLISYNTVRPCLDRANGIVNYEEPKTKKELQRFLGLVNYDRTFIENLSDKLKDLYALLNKDKKFIWTSKEKEIFNSVKEIWKGKLEVTIPDDNVRYILEADASNTGLGAVLSQNSKPIAFIYRLLTKEERNYSITEREVLASLWAMEKFQYYLFGKEFTLRSDHKAMEELKNKKEFGSARVIRWFERLERFQFKVEYKPGKQMIQSDALSRAATTCDNITKQNYETEILKIHINKNHRKNIIEELKKHNINIKKYTLDKILKNCLVCKKNDKKS